MQLTKKLITYITRMIIDKHELGVPFENEDLGWFKHLSRKEITGVKRMVNPEYPSDPRHIHVTTKTEKDWHAFSWKKLITPATDRAECMKIMRKLIEPDRDEAEPYVEVNCPKAVCQADPETNPLQMDHAETPFSVLADRWLDGRGELPKIEEHPSGVGYQFEDPEVEDSWVDYHLRNVIWQKLCRSCNASKGAK